MGANDQPHSHWFKSSLLLPVSRGLALFFGGFTILNIVGEILRPGFDATIWWIDFRPVPGWVSRTVLTIYSLLLLYFAVQPDRCSRTCRRATGLLTGIILLVCLLNVATFHALLGQGTIESSFPASLSLFVAVALGLVMLGVICGPTATRSSRHSRSILVSSALACVVGFPLLQMYCFGSTDYSRPADAAVVFGCKVYADGRLSAQLQDRVRSACELYHDGLVKYLIMSGGPGSGDVHETHAMRQFAVDQGVLPDDILVDEKGWSTDETVSSTTPMIRQLGFRRVLAVSHFYHLPRIKLSYQRMGQEVFTVPARQRYGIMHQGFQLGREVVALWAYYLRPVTGL